MSATGRSSHIVKPPEVSPIDIEMTSAYVFYKLARKPKNDGFVMLPRDHEKHFAAATTNAITADDYDYFMQGKKNYSMEELKKKVPAKYHSEIEVFVKQEADKLRPHGPRRVIQQPLARERSRTEREQCSSLK